MQVVLCRPAADPWGAPTPCPQRAGVAAAGHVRRTPFLPCLLDRGLSALPGPPVPSGKASAFLRSDGPQEAGQGLPHCAPFQSSAFG